MKHNFQLVIHTKYNVSKTDIYSALKDVFGTARIEVLDIIKEKADDKPTEQKSGVYDKETIAERKRAIIEGNAKQVGRKTKCLLVEKDPSSCFRCPYKDCIDNYVSISSEELEMNRALLKGVAK